MSTAECLSIAVPPSDGGEPELVQADVDLECNRPTTSQATQPMTITSPLSPKSHHSRGHRKSFRKKHLDESNKQRLHFQVRSRGFSSRGGFHVPTSRHVDQNLRVTLFQDDETPKDGAIEKEEKQPGVAEDELPPEDVTLPTDKLGRIKRGIDVRDYRPQAPRNTSQDLMVRKKLASRVESSPGTKDEIDVQAIQEFGSMVPFHRIIRKKLCDSFSDFDEDGSENDDEDDEELDESLQSEMNDYDDYVKHNTEERYSPIGHAEINGLQNATSYPNSEHTTPKRSLTVSSDGETPRRKRKTSISNDHWSNELPMTSQQDATSNLLLQWIQEQDETIDQLTKENKKLRKEVEKLKHSQSEIPPLPQATTTSS
eukprot:TRINITY_DN354_c0_g1_i1.p1 TRINITY_DN354_c0_g1~~TRINITY_DN354_c0_g1_i1.p1  ORF type:complete len:370 (-),score=73.72 TRINITY_DN354_c0_g1_i1:344-1453(-)